jgi:hypothetical protein
MTEFLLDLPVPLLPITAAGLQEATVETVPPTPSSLIKAMETNSASPESASKAISTATKGLTLTSVLKEANKANAAALGAILKPRSSRGSLRRQPPLPFTCHHKTPLRANLTTSLREKDLPL